MPRIVEVFGEQVRVHQVVDGMTLNKFAELTYPEYNNFPVPVLATQKKYDVVHPVKNEDLQIVFRDQWDTPLVGTQTIFVTALPKPQGGGGGGGGSGGVFQSVLGATLIIAAALMWWNPAGWAAFAGVSAWTLGSLAFTGAVLLLGGLMGTQQPKTPDYGGALGNEESSPTFSLNASSNQARLLQPIGEGFGKIQIVPDIVANPYVTYEGNDQFLYEVYGLGRGEYDVHEILYGEEAFWRDGQLLVGTALVESANDVTVQIVVPGGAVTLFPDNVESNSNVSQLQLFPTGHPDYSGWMGPYTSPSPGTKASKFQFDFLFPRGIGHWDSKGNLGGFNVGVGIQYRKVNDHGTPIGGWTRLPDWWTPWLATLTAQRFSHFVTLPEGRYEFQMVRLNGGSDGHGSYYVDDCYADGLRAYLPGTLRYNQSCLAIRIKATNRLSQSASKELRVTYTRKLPIWDPQTRTWSEPVATRRFDAAIAWMCKTDWGGRLTDERIDLDALHYCQQKCDENGWNFDAYIDSSYSVLELITQACASFRVYPRVLGDKISFVYDEANRPIKHVFTPRDIVRNSLIPSWATHTETTADDVIVSYLDEEQNYARREVQCTLPDSESREPKYVQYPIGICNRKLAHDYGIYLAACNRYRRIKLEFKIEALSRLLVAGDVVSVQHPRMHSLGFGKVVDWNEEERLIYVDMSEECANDPAKERLLYVVFNDTSGKPYGPVQIVAYTEGFMQLDADDFEVVKRQQGNIFEWITAGYDCQPTTYALLGANVVDRRYILENIKFSNLHTATLTVMNDDPRVYTQNVPVPPWNYRNTNSMLEELQTPTDMVARYDKDNGMVRVTWGSTPGAQTWDIRYYMSRAYIDENNQLVEENGAESNIRNLTVPYIDIPIENFTLGYNYLFLVRALNSNGVSDWAQTRLFVGDDSMASITVGTTLTGAPGTEAKVQNVGTDQAAIFNFTIPRGANGQATPIDWAASGVAQFISTTEESGILKATATMGVSGMAICRCVGPVSSSTRHSWQGHVNNANNICFRLELTNGVNAMCIPVTQGDVVTLQSNEVDVSFLISVIPYPTQTDTGDEQIVGNYMGKTRYRKTIEVTLPSGMTGEAALSDLSSLNIDKLLKMDGGYKNVAGDSLVPPNWFSATSSYVTTRLLQIQGAMQLVGYGTPLWEGSAGQITLEYTKKSD